MSVSVRVKNAEPSRAPLRSEQGFTLLEVVISFTLLALMVGVLYSAFFVSHRAINKAQARSETGQGIRSMDEFLSGYIRSAYPYRISQQFGVFFGGARDSLSFVSALSVGSGGRGMAKVRLLWEGAPNKPGRLILEEEMPVRFGDEAAGTGYKNTLVLGEELRDFRFDYLDPQKRPAQWIEEWEGEKRNSLPSAVRLTYWEKGGQEIHWVFPIMMTVLPPSRMGSGPAAAGLPGQP